MQLSAVSCSMLSSSTALKGWSWKPSLYLMCLIIQWLQLWLFLFWFFVGCPFQHPPSIVQATKNLFVNGWDKNYPKNRKNLVLQGHLSTGRIFDLWGQPPCWGWTERQAHASVITAAASSCAHNPRERGDEGIREAKRMKQKAHGLFAYGLFGAML